MKKIWFVLGAAVALVLLVFALLMRLTQKGPAPTFPPAATAVRPNTIPASALSTSDIYFPAFTPQGAVRFFGNGIEELNLSSKKRTVLSSSFDFNVGAVSALQWNYDASQFFAGIPQNDGSTNWVVTTVKTGQNQTLPHTTNSAVWQGNTLWTAELGEQTTVIKTWQGERAAAAYNLDQRLNVQLIGVPTGSQKIYYWADRGQTEGATVEALDTVTKKSTVILGDLPEVVDGAISADAQLIGLTVLKGKDRVLFIVQVGAKKLSKEQKIAVGELVVPLKSQLAVVTAKNGAVAVKFFASSAAATTQTFKVAGLNSGEVNAFLQRNGESVALVDHLPYLISNK